MPPAGVYTKGIMKSTLVFDFDGTIADTLHHLVDISNTLSEEFNFKFIAPDDLEILQDKTTREVIQHLGVPMMKIPVIVAKAKKLLHEQMNRIQPIEGLKDILWELKEARFQLGILSSTSSENVKKFLTRHGLTMFDFIETTSKIWTKNTSLNRLIKHHQLDTNKTVYIGDETRDIEAAKRSGIKIAAVTWGYNSGKTLQSYDPDYLLNAPTDLIRIFKNNHHA